MTMSPRVVALLQNLRDEPPEVFAQRLVIENLQNDLQPMSPLLVEQFEYLRVLASHRITVAIKPRQVGFTTAATLFFLAMLLRSPSARTLLQTVHDEDAFVRVRRMVEVAYRGLPRILRGGMRSNAKRTEFVHNNARVQRLIAGKRGQGRSATYNDFMATEAAFYPLRSSALAGADQAVDSDLFSSILAAMHDSTGRVLVESTGNGPEGFFPRLVASAASGRDPNVGLVFLPWTASPRHQRDVPEGFELTDEELRLQKDHGLTLRQLSWRRYKFEVELYTTVRFRREYPLTLEEPFRLDDAAWFSQDALGAASALAMKETPTVSDGLVKFLEPEPGRKYFIGADTSGGVRKDEFVLQVLRDDLQHAATFASSNMKEPAQAMTTAKVASLYNGAMVLVEQNNFGHAVTEILVAMGVRLWRDHATGDFYFASREKKKQTMLIARRRIDEYLTRPADLPTVLQLQTIVEKPNGRIEARSGHDDRAIAYCLAILCAERFTGYLERYDADAARELAREKAKSRINSMFGGAP